MELADALTFAREHKNAVLTTIRSNGRPQLSNIIYTVSDEGVIRISITADRAKYKNLAREPWAALHITRDDFYAYAVIEGDVELSAIAVAPDDAAVEELIEVLPRHARRAPRLGRLPGVDGPGQARRRAHHADAGLRDGVSGGVTHRRVSSSQSNTTSLRHCGAIGASWNWAPSATVKFTMVLFFPGRASKSC